MQSKKRSPGKKLLFSVIILVLLLLAGELVCRAFYYNYANKKSLRGRENHSIAIVQLYRDIKGKLNRKLANPDKNSLDTIVQNQRLVRKNATEKENSDIAHENSEANKFRYQAWVDFSMRDMQGKYVNIKNRVRKSVPAASDSTAKDYFTIYFIGGSTMYGFNVTDEETIPSYFVKAYKKRFPAGKPIRVVNYGTPYYFSYQELMCIADKLFRGETPGMIIMLDGLNDGIQVSSSLQREHFFTQQFRQLVTPEQPAPAEKGSPYKVPDGLNKDSVYEQIYQNYIQAIGSVKSLTGLYTIPLYCFVQPVPFFQYANKANDPICSPASYPQFAYLYPKLEKKTAELDYLFYLGNMLQHEKGLPYIDHFHYAPATNAAIAEKMMEVIKF